mmetsp:Transcript_34636/g.73743  ORF Transcript_34636/g.73743 Transcript_34636/m.73743 type:complete len:372 (+) Transcript_34636:802-1917(+)
MLVMKKTTALFIESLQPCIDNAPNTDDARHTTGSISGEEGCRARQVALNLVELCGAPRDNVEAILRTMGCPTFLWVLEWATPLPSMVAPDVPSPAIPARASEARANLSCTSWIRRLLVIDGDLELPTVEPFPQDFEGRAPDGLHKQDKSADARTVSLGDHLRHGMTLKELLNILFHHLVVPTAEIWAEPAKPQVSGGPSNHTSITARFASLHTAALADSKCHRLCTALLWQGQQSHCQRFRAGPELHKIKRQGLDSTIPLLQDVVLCLVNPVMIKTLLPKQQLAEEHECSSSGVADGHIRVLREVLASTEHLAASALRVEAIDGDGQNISIGGAMPAIYNVRPVAQGFCEVALRCTEQHLQARVADLPSTS